MVKPVWIESAGRFQYMTTYSYNPYAYVVNGKYTPGFTEGNLASPDLTWYTTRQMDFGFDFASLNNRLYAHLIILLLDKGLFGGSAW